jgi:hypothetical protein
LRGLGKMDLAAAARPRHRLARRRRRSACPPRIFRTSSPTSSKRLRSAYEVAPQNWKRLARQNNAPDFKARAVTQLSNLPNLKKIKEGGEYTTPALADGKEQYALAPMAARS